MRGERETPVGPDGARTIRIVKRAIRSSQGATVGLPGRQAGLIARLGSTTPEPGSVLGGEAQPGCGGGVAELGDRLGPDTVHPGEIALGRLGELLHGDIPGRGQRMPRWPGQARGQVRGRAGLRLVQAVTKPARWVSELPR